MTSGRRRGSYAEIHGGRLAQSLAGPNPPASTTSGTESMVGAEVGILHEVQFVYWVDHGARAQVERLVRRVGRVLVGVVLNLEVL